MIIYLINCLCLIMCHFVANVLLIIHVACLLCIMHVVVLPPSFLEMIRDSPGNTTLLGDFSQPSFFSVSRWRGSFSILRQMWPLSQMCRMIGFYCVFQIVHLLLLLLMTRLQNALMQPRKPFWHLHSTYFVQSFDGLYLVRMVMISSSIRILFFVIFWVMYHGQISVYYITQQQ